MRLGKLKSYLAFSESGYIQEEESKAEYYVPKKELKEVLKEGDLVRFELKENKYGYYAANVRKQQ